MLSRRDCAPTTFSAALRAGDLPPRRGLRQSWRNGAPHASAALPTGGRALTGAEAASPRSSRSRSGATRSSSARTRSSTSCARPVRRGPDGRHDWIPTLERLLRARPAGRSPRPIVATGRSARWPIVALDAIERRVGSLRGREVLVVGAGKMGRLALGAARQPPAPRSPSRVGPTRAPGALATDRRAPGRRLRSRRVRRRVRRRSSSPSAGPGRSRDAIAASSQRSTRHRRSVGPGGRRPGSPRRSVPRFVVGGRSGARRAPTPRQHRMARAAPRSRRSSTRPTAAFLDWLAGRDGRATAEALVEQCRTRTRGRARGAVAAASGPRTRGTGGDRGDDRATWRRDFCESRWSASAETPTVVTSAPSGTCSRCDEPGDRHRIAGQRPGACPGRAGRRARSRRDGRASRIVIIETDGDRRAPGHGVGRRRLRRGDRASPAATAASMSRSTARRTFRPTRIARLRIAAYLPRADPRDALVVRADAGAQPRRPASRDPASGRTARAATGFLLARRPDLVVHPLHGNVDTRLRRLDDGETDALVLACAGSGPAGARRPDRGAPRTRDHAAGARSGRDRRPDPAATTRGCWPSPRPSTTVPTRVAVEAERAFLALRVAAAARRSAPWPRSTATRSTSSVAMPVERSDRTVRPTECRCPRRGEPGHAISPRSCDPRGPTASNVA